MGWPNTGGLSEVSVAQLGAACTVPWVVGSTIAAIARKHRTVREGG